MKINDLEILKHWKDTKFVVTMPGKHSTLTDIMFETTPYGLALQIEGGLNPASVFGVFDDQNSAEQIASNLLEVRSKF